MSIFDPSFNYTPSISTDVASTWRKFGFKPTSEADRVARDEKRAALYAPRTPLDLSFARNPERARAVALRRISASGTR